MRIALRVEVNSLRGLREGVSNLMRLFSEYQVRASFFFPMGRDDSGRWPLVTWRRRRRLDMASLLRGTMLPGPSLAEEGGGLASTTAANGHEVGLFGGSPHAWRARLAHADNAWVNAEFDEMLAAFGELGVPFPVPLATPGWQVNPALLSRMLPDIVSFSSCTRGKYPFLPLSRGVLSAVPEVPTTLPTVDEMLCRDGVSRANVHEYLYAESQKLLPAGHVFTLDAESEGLEGLPLMEKLLVMWKGQEGSVRALGDLLDEVDRSTLPVHQIGWGHVHANDEVMAMQSVQVQA